MYLFIFLLKISLHVSYLLDLINKEKNTIVLKKIKKKFKDHTSRAKRKGGTLSKTGRRGTNETSIPKCHDHLNREMS